MSRLFLHTLLLVLCCWSVCDGVGAAPKKRRSQRKEQPAPQLSAYEKLFDGKRTVSSEGLITFRLTDDGKLYAEFPRRLLGRELLYASVIEETSGPAEGVAGQFSDNNVPLRFELQDSMLYVCHSRDDAPVNRSGDSSVDRSLREQTIPGLWKRFPVLAATEDDTAVVAEVSDLFMTHFSQLATFPKDAYNSMGGQIMRTHTPLSERSRLLGVRCTESYASVDCDQSYKLDGYVFGFMKIHGDFRLRAVVRKMLYLPPETPMRARAADSRAGVQPAECAVLEDVCKPLGRRWHAKRWRLEPADSAAYAAGERVPPVKPVVFHLDTMVPQQWRPYVREGVLAWNDAFERIGFRDVVRVADFPRDTAFDSTAPSLSTIRFSPCGKNSCDCSLQTDSRTGEILNATICLHSGVLEYYADLLVVQAAASQPKLRTGELPEEMMGAIVRAVVMQAVGRSLGLERNPGASYAYPVDSLRSASFTSRYGIVSSVMEDLVFNYVAQPEDVARGARLVQECLGPTDYQVIRWLYAPVSGAATAAEERAELERWIAESAREPYVRFRSRVASGFDPTALSGELGDDLFRSMDYLTVNQKRMAAHLYEWFGEEDRDLELRARIFSSMTDRYARQLCLLQRCLGGFVLNDIRGGDDAPAYVPLPRETQRRALRYIVAALRDLDWLDRVPVREMPYGTSEYITEVYRVNIMRSTMERLGHVSLCGDRLQDGYSSRDFMQDLYDEIFGRDLRRGGWTSYEMSWQMQLLDRLISGSGLKEIRERREREALARRRAKARAVASEVGLTSADRDAESGAGPLWTAAGGTDRETASAIGSAPDAGDVSAEGDFYPTAPLRNPAVAVDIAPWCLQTLQQLREDLRAALPAVDEETREHYRFMLFSMERVFAVKP